MNFKLIIFDLDGTLIDSMSVWRDVDTKFFAKRNIPMPDDLFDDMQSNNITGMAVHIKKRFSLTESPEEIINEWLTSVEYAYKNTIELKPNATELLNHIRSKNIKLAIGTSNERNLTSTILKRHNILDYFDSIVCGCDCENGKPAPDIFLKIAQNMNIAPADCLVVEDSILGVRAGKNAGMKVYAIADKQSERDKDDIVKEADAFFEGLEGVLNKLLT